ncbi:MAG: hypothetical protein BAJALOKI2v1_50016 [Promethearchaeota archaeon]|nr:MAG: hypothetical protein BAJALOKI2v1_50016 [Candidatus Lokiarchaeota archaeon]
MDLIGIFNTYMESFHRGIELSIALGSILGILGLILGLIGAIFSNSMRKEKFHLILIISFILIAICGLFTGIKYFRIFR